MKRKDNKKFGFEKFEIAKLSSKSKIQGGNLNVFIKDTDPLGNGDGNNNHDPGTVTDALDAIKSFFCSKKD